MNRDLGKKMAPVRKMAEGGSVGFWERLRAGNIDEPGSEANMRWGSGKKAMDAAVAAEQASRAPLPSAEDNMQAVRDSIAADAPKVSAVDKEKFDMANAEPAGMEALEDNDPARKVMKPAAAPAPAAAKRRKAPPAPTGGAAGGLASGLKYGRDSALEARAPSPSPAPAPRPATKTTNPDNDPVVRGAKWIGERLSGFGKAVGDTVSGIANSKITYKPAEGAKSIYAYKDGGMVKGYAKGGMVSDGRSYGKKC